MPSRIAHLIAFLSIVTISVSLHAYIYRQLRSLIRRDFPRQSKRLVGIAKWLFIYFELPFIALFFWKYIPFYAPGLVNFILYPFAVWQMLLLVWAVILVPLGIFRSRAFQKSVVKPFAKVMRRFFRPRKQQNENAFPELLPATDEA